ncbi:MAG: amidohydrolase family protein [Campylobacteraceae bacterium]|jgi:dihydroorotase|nr:amidohydrolase family protein [Campylobacteraceae bacterium]
MLIKNAKISGEESLKDVLIEGDKIVKIADSIKGENEVIDAKGAYLLSGLIDLNVRLKNGVLNQKNLDTLSNDCARGGVTTSLIIPDFLPRLDNESFLELLNAKVHTLPTTIFLSAPLVNEETDKLNNIATLIQNGAIAVWGKSHVNSNLIRRGIQYAKMKQTPFLIDCYDNDLDDNGVMNEGEVSFKLGLPGISKVSETSEVAKLCEIAGYYEQKPILFQTLSAKRSIELINGAKKSLNAYAEVSIHHLLKNDSSCDEFNTYAKIKPPLRDEDERQKLIEELKEGGIDILTSAHSPRSILYKDVAFEEAAYGIHAVCDYLCLAYTHLVDTKLISIEQLIDLTSKTPAKILGLKTKGEIKEGFDADLVIFDTEYKEKLNIPDSIYSGETLKGRVLKTIAKGKLVFERA